MWEIRPFEPADLDGLYAISLATGNLGTDASRLYADPRIMGHVYAGAYAALEPSLVLLLADGEGVAGFAVGVLDTVEWETRLERDWWPSLRERYSDPSGISELDRTSDERRAHTIHHPKPTPTEVSRTFPAHLHMNLLPRAQGMGQGTRLLHAWLRLAVNQGAYAFHVGVNRNNHRAMAFWQRRHFAPVFDQERTAWLGLQNFAQEGR